MVVLYVFLFWILPFVFYLCYPIVLVYSEHALAKNDKHYTVGELFSEANTKIYSAEIYADAVFGTVIPVLNCGWLFFILRLEFQDTEMHTRYVDYIKNPICKFLSFIYSIIRFVLYPIIYVCKVIRVGMSEVKRYICNIQII